ncbi:beta-ketoacyl-ACP synthase II [Geomonas sp. Red875]|uniref:3-oxoacyl-[acyl-carrier-protein] synthase 2 n=1 Tax=Geomesophilobacter sediminis TaxID=2798584 RepID=A0A8J7M1X5_9BACT|nr:beta-ketoacyl-ACP synthase II [Geomesophilobacter sediminis]
MELKRAVVTGLGAITPVGNTVAETWAGLVAGKSGAGPITRFDAGGFRTRFACEVKGFDPRDHFEAKEAKKLDLFSQFSMVAAGEAFQDAGLHRGGFDPTRAGVVWASGMGGLATLDEQLLDYGERRGRPRFSPFFVPRIIANIASGLISIRYGLQGVNFSVVSACASSTNALAEALLHIRLGKADLVIAGGAEAAITESGVGGFSAMKALSERNDDPLHASRPFDADRDGFVIGEGAGALVLEEYGHAVRRGARIYAELCGVGTSADAYHMTATHPEGDGAWRAMREALEDAGIPAGAVNHVSVHATSTPLGDLSEIKAIERLFAPHFGNFAVSAVKSATGHLLGAAGALAAISCVKSIGEQVIPSTINTKVPDPGLPDGIDLTLETARSRPVAVAMNNAFGFGGHCASAVFATCEER